MNRNLVDKLSMKELIEKYPFAENFFVENNIIIEGYEDETFSKFLKMFTEEQKEDMALDVENIKISLIEYVEQMKLFLGMEEEIKIIS